jgi:hypothetical protein
MVTMKDLRKIKDYINNNIQILNNKVNEIGMTEIKLLFIKHFNGLRSKLKGSLL